MVVREAGEDELDEVSAVLAAAWAEYQIPPDAPPERLEAFTRYKTSVADVRSRLHDSVLLVAADGAGIIGSVTFYPPNGDAPVGEGWPSGWAGIRLLGVRPEARGRGVGRALTLECLSRARRAGATHVGLHTTEMMDVAKAMYERMGFTRVPAHDIPVPPDFVVEAYMLPLR